MPLLLNESQRAAFLFFLLRTELAISSYGVVPVVPPGAGVPVVAPGVAPVSVLGVAGAGVAAPVLVPVDVVSELPLHAVSDATSAKLAAARAIV